jgi:hypothetical protein
MALCGISWVFFFLLFFFYSWSDTPTGFEADGSLPADVEVLRRQHHDELGPAKVLPLDLEEHGPRDEENGREHRGDERPADPCGKTPSPLD